jgi:hypothetical protein
MDYRRAARNLFLVTALCVGTYAYGQRERQVPPPQQGDYGEKFFDELRRIFGRFRDSDLRRVFDSAGPIPCSELVTDKGEWREVAFFNENRKLGDWYRTSLDEVKDDLAVYVFKGSCGGARAAVQVTTKFPVEESIHAFQDRRIKFEDIDVNVNAPVTASFNSQTRAYTFDLPYLFRESDQQNGGRLYTLYPKRLSDRYATEVINRWECKAVSADDVTYQFLICNTSLVDRQYGGGQRNQDRGSAFGSTAYSILSDGKEASSSVTLSFGDATEPANVPAKPRSPEPTRETARSAPAARTWKSAASQARLNDIGQSEFRLRFKPETWKGKIDKPQTIVDGAVSPSPAVLPRGKDYCLWKPVTAATVNQLLDPTAAESIEQTLEFKKDSAASITAVFEMRSDSGRSLGQLQCAFQQTQTPADVTVSRWASIAGSTIALETPGQ